MHRIVMEKRLGRRLKSSELIHHKDSDRTNFSEDNLQLTDNTNHALIHKLGIVVGRGR